MAGIITQSGMLSGGYDADAQAWIDKVETADAQTLEDGLKDVMNDFILDLKANNLWSGLNTMNVLCCARTLAGILVDVKDPTRSWTNNNFVIGDYDRTNGLTGNGSNKYLDMGVNADAESQDDAALWVYVQSSSSGTNKFYASAGRVDSGAIGFRKQTNSATRFYNRSNTNDSTVTSVNTAAAGLLGSSRDNSTDFDFIMNGSVTTPTVSSQTTLSANIYVMAANDGGDIAHADATLQIAGFGQSVDLATLDTVTDTFITAVAALSL